MRFISSMTTRFAIAIAAATVLFTAPARAQFIWSNGAGGNWSDGANWGGVGPAPGGSNTTTLTFGPNGPYTATNNLAGVFNLNLLTFNHASGLVTIAPSGGSSLNFTGTNPGIVLSGAGNATISSPISLDQVTTTISGTGTGGLTISGAITEAVTNTSNLIKTSVGDVTLSGGGSFRQFSIQNGNGFITGGTLGLTADTGTGNVNSGLRIAAQTGGTATGTVSGASTIVNVTENVYIADQAGSTGSTSTLIVRDGAVINNTSTTSGRLGIGNGGGDANLQILNGGVVNSNMVFVARIAGSANNTVLVDGVGSTLHGVVQLSMGTAGNGTITVQNGGTAFTEGSINIGRAAGAGISGQLNVSGAGSTATTGTASVAGQLTVGVLGTGGVAITNGGTVTANGNTFMGTNPGVAGTVTVDGASSTLITTGQYSMSGGTAGVAGGTVDVTASNGGSIQIGGLTILGQSPVGGTANLTLNTGSTFTTAGQFQVAPPDALGASAVTSTISITGGSNLTVTNQTAFFAIGTGSVSNLNVTGANSIFQTTGTGQIQFGGSGTTAGGTATVNIGTGGTVQTSSDPAALVFVFAPATVNVNSGGTLTSPNIGVAGRLIANGAVNGAVDVATGGFLGGTSGISGSIGTITGNVDVNSGATLRPGDGTATGAGILTVAGTGNVVTIASGGTFSVNVNGPTPGNGPTNHAQLVLTGGATIDITGSTLQTTLGYAPAPGQVITIITGGAVTGTFNGLPDNQLFQVGTFSGTDYFANIRYTANTVFFQVVPEPLHVLGLGALVCGGVTWLRKRRKANPTLAA